MPSEVGSEIGHENEKLIGLIMGGDRRAADLLFASYLPQLRRTAAWVLPNSDDSEDAVQDGLLLAYRHLNQFQGRAKFSTWLHRIVINASLAKMRKQRSKLTTSIDQEASGEETSFIADILVDPRPNPEQKYINDERSRILAEMLEDLSTTSRMVIQPHGHRRPLWKRSGPKIGHHSVRAKRRDIIGLVSRSCKMQEPHERMNA